MGSEHGDPPQPLCASRFVLASSSLAALSPRSTTGEKYEKLEGCEQSDHVRREQHQERNNEILNGLIDFIDNGEILFVSQNRLVLFYLIIHHVIWLNLSHENCPFRIPGVSTTS